VLKNNTSINRNIGNKDNTSDDTTVVEPKSKQRIIEKLKRMTNEDKTKEKEKGKEKDKETAPSPPLRGVIMATRCDKDQKRILNGLCKSLGGFTLSPIYDHTVTHLVIGSVTHRQGRTLKLYTAIAKVCINIIIYNI